jgi:hypothetical protein
MDAAKTPVPWVHYWGDNARPSGSFQVDDACVTALQTLHPKGERAAAPEHFGGNPLACNPDKHGDAAVIRDWLASTKHESGDLQVIFWLAYFVRNEWAKLPKRTRSEHRELYGHVAKLCRDLRNAMDSTDTGHLDGTGYGLQRASTLALLTEDEVDNLVDACVRTATETGARVPLDHAQRRLLGILNTPPCAGLPNFQELLGRLEAQAKLLELDGPMHPQPQKRGAERGYFIRRIGELFARRYRERPHEVIAALTTIALGEATDRELVAKLLAPRTL